MAFVTTSPARASSAERRTFGDGPELVEAGAIRLRMAFRLPVGMPLATVLVLPGRAEFIEKYERTLAELTGWGFACAILDWRGQGGSARLLANPRKGHVADFADYLDDLAALAREARRRGMPERSLILAHSMGGHIAFRALGDGRIQPLAAALIAPMFDIGFKLPEWLVRGLAAMAMSLGLGPVYAPGQRDDDLLTCRFEGNPLTSDPESFARWRRLLAKRPELRLGGVTYGWLAAALASIAHIRAPGFAEAVAQPILIARAGCERIVSNRAMAAIGARLPRATLFDLPGARHDLLWEAEAHRARLMAVLHRFLLDNAV